MKQSLELSTSRLILVGAHAALLLADRHSQESFATVLKARVPPSWPPEHHDQNVIDWALRSLEERTPNTSWNLYYVLLESPRTAIGTCGFTGPPGASGCVEVGYSLVPEFRGRGFATEAVEKLINTAFEFGASEVAAQTYLSLTASLRVMQKCGMAAAGAGAEPGTVRYAVRR